MKSRGRLEKRIFTVLMTVIIMVFAVFTIMMALQGVLERSQSAEYAKELVQSSDIISSGYKSLTDNALLYLAGEQAAEADEVFCKIDLAIRTLQKNIDYIMANDYQDEPLLDAPKEDAPEGKASSYLLMNAGTDMSSSRVDRDLEALADIAPYTRSTIDPDGSIYSCIVSAVSGPTLCSNGFEKTAAEKQPDLSQWTGDIFAHYNPIEDYIKEGDDIYIRADTTSIDPILKDDCFMIETPIIRGKKLWGMAFYFVQGEFFDGLVNPRAVDERDICFITSPKHIVPLMSSDTEVFYPTEDMEEKERLKKNEPDVWKKLLEGFEKSDKGIVRAKLNQPIADSKEIIFYFATIEEVNWRFVVGRAATVTEERSEHLKKTLSGINAEAARMRQRNTITTVMTFILALFLAGAAASYFSIRYSNILANPIRVLTKKVEAVRGDSLDFTWDKLGSDDDETEILASSFAGMTVRLKEDIKKLTEMTTARERINSELSLASDIQRSMLPDLDGRFKGNSHFGMYAFMRPARAVGGDFYDFFMVNENTLAFLVADVSDKGVGAALFMAVSKSTIRSCAAAGGSPSEVLGRANALLLEENDASMFVTVFLAYLNLDTGEMVSANAGHDEPALCLLKENGEREFEIREEDHGSPLAFWPGASFPDIKRSLLPGDRIFIYTDGVNEAQGKSGEQFGIDRLVLELNKNRETDEEKLCMEVCGAVDDFVGEDPQFDDITMLCITYKG